MDICRNDIEFVSFDEIDFGGIFTFEDCVDNVYMKIDFHDEINIVNLKTGDVGYCSCSEPVIKLKATLVID